MKSRFVQVWIKPTIVTIICIISYLLVPCIAFAASPFSTGAFSLQTNVLAILTPIAVIAVMVTGVAAAFGKISWWWFAGVIIGVILIFGAPQIVSWIRSMAGV